jgi:hypothetical protein
VSYQERERKRLSELAKQRWQVEGHVLPYALAAETLHESGRESALAYFSKHGVTWWTSRWDVGRPQRGGDDTRFPTGHLNSSQVACINHLEPARLDSDLALQVARNVDRRCVEVEPVEDGGFVAYEWIGQGNYLAESGPRVRGANITSLDALMCARLGDGSKVLLVVEWKYLEAYGPKSVARSARGTDRVATYRPLLERDDCPIAVSDLGWLFYEPYYQLMRQTLLAWQMVEHRELDATDWLHVHVVPEANIALRRAGRTAVGLVGQTMEEKWRSVLKEPERYRLLTPSDLLDGIGESGRWRVWREWLCERYLT